MRSNPNLEIEWADLKSFLDSRSSSNCQYVEFSNAYHIKGYDGIFEVLCKIKKESPASADQTDFETNYKPNANKPNILQTGNTAVKEPNGKRARLKGCISGTAAANSTSAHDWLIPQMQYPAGTNVNSIFDGVEYYCKDSTMGDNICFQVVDKDGTGVTLGLYPQAYYDAYKDGNGVLLVEEFGDSWYVAPNALEDILLYKARLLPGLYLRICYINTHPTQDTKFFVNIFRHIDP